MAAKRYTIDDVARRAGVSKTTVSMVLNGKGAIRDSTRDRVLATVEQLNYRPSGQARRSVAGKKRSIGLLVREIDNPFFAEIVTGVRAVADDQGYSVLLASSEGGYEAERQAVELFQERDVDGLILYPVLNAETDLSHLFELKRRNVPFILLEAIWGVQASLIDVDNVDASRKAVEYLISLGHTRIVHFAGPQYSMHSRERIDGMVRAFSESRLIFTDDAIVPAGAHLKDGYRVGLEYFGGRAEEERPTAVTCYNDMVAIGLYRALAELGLQVPGDVSVIGYDDIEMLAYFPVPLTSVHVPRFEIGQKATQILVQHIESHQALRPQRISFNAELVVRRSTRSLLADGSGPVAGGRPRG
jgi:LacI family transcriptional regulator/LacI family repressor for deo operon, udp, cdd, tsx, nupC, and nupG